MVQNDRVDVSIVVAMRDESSLVDDLLRRLDPVVAGFAGSCEVIAVDDASSDDTWQRLRDCSSGRPWLKGLKLAWPSGRHAATFAGLETARGAIIVTLDADLEVTPGDIAGLVARVERGSDLVFAPGSHPGAGFLRGVLGPAVVRALARFAVGRPPDGISSFLAARRSIVEAALNSKVARPVTPYHLMLGGPRNVSCLDARESGRPSGRSRYGLLRLMGLAADICFGYTTLPQPLLVLTACAVPAGTVVLWLMATALRSAGLQLLSTLFALISVFYALAMIALVLVVVGELALRAGQGGRPLYRVSDTF